MMVMRTIKMKMIKGTKQQHNKNTNHKNDDDDDNK